MKNKKYLEARDFDTFYKITKIIGHNPKLGNSTFAKFDKLETENEKNYRIILERNFKGNIKKIEYLIEITKSEITCRINNSNIEYNLVDNQDTTMSLYYGDTLLLHIATDAQNEINFMNKLPNTTYWIKTSNKALHSRIRKR